MPPPPPPSASYLWNWKEDEDSSICSSDKTEHENGAAAGDPAEEGVEFLDTRDPARTSNSSNTSVTAGRCDTSSMDEKRVTPRASSSSKNIIENHKTSTFGTIDNHRTQSSDTLTTTVEQIQNEEQERFVQQQQKQQEIVDAYYDNESNTPADVNLRLLHSEEDEEEEEAASACANNNNKRLSKAQRKRKQKKKGKTKKTTVPTTATHVHDLPLVETKQVAFGSVTVHWFERCLGLDVVPGDGGWPLGMGELVARAEAQSIHDYETEKQDRLKLRWENAVQQPQQQHDLNRKVDQTSTSCSAATAAQPQDFETRQFDYRRGAKNPLFRMLTELERMNLLLAASSNTDDEEHDSTKHPSSSCGERHRSTRRTRSRSGSFSETSSNSSTQQHSHRPRSNSHTSSFSSMERYNDQYPQPAVHHVRNELEQIRHARTKAGATGCTCRKLHVYLVPPDGGKKAHHRRLKLAKVKDELRKRHALPVPDNNKSREELEQLLHDLVEAEPCCGSSSDCPCARDGVGCQADTCTCWHASHLTKQQQQQEHGSGDESSSSFVPSLVQQRCGNPHGMYVVDLDHINVVRRKVLTTMTMCAPVEMMMMHGGDSAGTTTTTV